MGDLQFTQRKTVNIKWDTEEVKGKMVSIAASSSDLEEPKEVRNTENDGYATVTFPSDFTGECEITVTGSRGGSQSGTVTVS